MTVAAKDAREIDRAGVSGTRVQRRRHDQRGQRPREGDDVAAEPCVCVLQRDIRPGIERTARGCSRIHSIDLMLRAPCRLPPNRPAPR